MDAGKDRYHFAPSAVNRSGTVGFGIGGVAAAGLVMVTQIV